MRGRRNRKRGRGSGKGRMERRKFGSLSKRCVWNTGVFVQTDKTTDSLDYRYPFRLSKLLQIGNACGSIGLLHSLLNLPSNLLSPDSPLTTFKSQSLPLTPLSRAQLLDTSPFFEQAHNSSVSSGQSKVPVSQEEIDTDNHFLSFVMGEHKDGSKHVCEMDGSYRDGPFDRGQTSEESFLTVSGAV
jgi:hypothetical protein